MNEKNIKFMIFLYLYNIRKHNAFKYLQTDIFFVMSDRIHLCRYAVKLLTLILHKKYCRHAVTIFLTNYLLHSFLQLFYKQTTDCVQHSKDHNTYICKNRQIHIRNAHSP